MNSGFPEISVLITNQCRPPPPPPPPLIALNLLMKSQTSLMAQGSCRMTLKQMKMSSGVLRKMYKTSQDVLTSAQRQSY